MIIFDQTFSKSLRSMIIFDQTFSKSLHCRRVDKECKPIQKQEAKRSWVRLEPHEWRASDFPGGTTELLRRWSEHRPYELTLSQYTDAFLMYLIPDWMGLGEAALKLARKKWLESIKEQMPYGMIPAVVMKEYIEETQIS